jgi:hypothetical protein
MNLLLSGRGNAPQMHFDEYTSIVALGAYRTGAQKKTPRDLGRAAF